MSHEIKEVWASRLGVAVNIQPLPHLDPRDYGAFMSWIGLHLHTKFSIYPRGNVSRKRANRKLCYVFEYLLIPECDSAKLLSVSQTSNGALHKASRIATTILLFRTFDRFSEFRSFWSLLLQFTGFDVRFCPDRVMW